MFQDRVSCSRSRKRLPQSSTTAAHVEGRKSSPSPFSVQIVRATILNRFLCIRYRRRNHISPARPFAKVNRSAALATERKVRIGALYSLFANRAPDFCSTLARHGFVL